MKDLRTIRIFLAILFFVLAVAYLAISPTVHPIARVVAKIQIIPSLIAVGMGAVLIWFAITFVFGRIYCSTICPVGTYQDVVIWLRRRFGGARRPLSFRQPDAVRFPLAVIFYICLPLGVAVVPFWLEPWSIMRNICGAIHPSAQEEIWLELGIGMATGIAAGILSGALLAVCAFFTGRSFCTEICPVGTALGLLSDYTLLHIEIDPDKCIDCMKCEEICEAHCIKVVSRYVDNSRCIRCFDCLKVCPNDAIRYQIHRNRRATPLMNKVGGEK
ncbi:MAG: 4Fe-4S binding protein [Muribaculaceae bacterium]|nr:4Fe-4S binding protein [Muribaculaceae bacterium]MDE6009144.1 4Fe-4S binding protein [Muribaculaceae bacterium]MDE6793499.1 4Fe-4S binding protein [Muribaculaceae bacterium]